MPSDSPNNENDIIIGELPNDPQPCQTSAEILRVLTEDKQYAQKILTAIFRHKTLTSIIESSTPQILENLLTKLLADSTLMGKFIELIINKGIILRNPSHKTIARVTLLGVEVVMY